MVVYVKPRGYIRGKLVAESGVCRKAMVLVRWDNMGYEGHFNNEVHSQRWFKKRECVFIYETWVTVLWKRVKRRIWIKFFVAKMKVKASVRSNFR